jgi:hypothetical protein
MYYLAEDAGFSWLSFLWPLVTEAAVVIFSLVYLVSKVRGYKNMYLMPLIMLCTAISVGLNVAHAPTVGIVNAIAWSLPPLLLFGAFKTWIWITEQDLIRLNMIKSLDDLDEEFTSIQLDLSQFEREAKQTRQSITSEIEALAAKKTALEAKIDELKAEQREIKRDFSTSVGDETRYQAWQILAERPDISGAALGRKLGKSDSLGRRLKREFEGLSQEEAEPVVYVNGRG